MSSKSSVLKGRDVAGLMVSPAQWTLVNCIVFVCKNESRRQVIDK